MAQFIGLYRGHTVSEAELVAVCSDERIVKMFFEELVKPQMQGSGEAMELAVVRGDGDE